MDKSISIMLVKNGVCFSIECPSGYFGMNCNEKCSGNCINKETCNHVNGVCPSECQDGFLGIHCNKCKILFQSFHFLLVTDSIDKNNHQNTIIEYH